MPGDPTKSRINNVLAILSDNESMDMLEQQYPGTLTMAKELHLFAYPTFIPSYLNWLNSPQDFNVHGPRFLMIFGKAKTIFAIVDSVRKQFLAATFPSAFVIFLQFDEDEQHQRVHEYNIENATTKEQLVVRNAISETPETEVYYGGIIRYAEIVRHPTDAEAKMREWIDKRAYFEDVYKTEEDEKEDEEGPQP